MKPTRIRMCHALVMNYGLYKKMEIFVRPPLHLSLHWISVEMRGGKPGGLTSKRAKPATKREMTQFHTDEYVEFLHRVTPETAQQYNKEQIKCGSLAHARDSECAGWS